MQYFHTWDREGRIKYLGIGSINVYCSHIVYCESLKITIQIRFSEKL